MPNPGELLPPAVTALLADEIPGAVMTVGAGAATVLAEAWCGAGAAATTSWRLASAVT